MTERRRVLIQGAGAVSAAAGALLAGTGAEVRAASAHRIVSIPCPTAASASSSTATPGSVLEKGTKPKGAISSRPDTALDNGDACRS